MWIHLLTKLAWGISYFHSPQPGQAGTEGEARDKRAGSQAVWPSPTRPSGPRSGQAACRLMSGPGHSKVCEQARLLPTALLPVCREKGDCPGLHHPELVLRPRSQTYRGGCFLTHLDSSLCTHFSCSLGRIMKTITSSFGSTGDKYLEKNWCQPQKKLRRTL